MTIIFDGTQGITTPTETANNSVTTPVVKSSANLVFQINGTTEAMRIVSSGNVGIGTATPSRQFELYGPSIAGTGMQITSTSGSAGIKFVPPSGSAWEIQAQTVDQFSAYNRSTDVYGWRIDSAGRVTKPSQPFFYARKTGSQTVPTGTTVTFDAITTNIGSHYSTSTNRFTAPIAGVYSFTAKVWMSKGGGSYADFSPRINGTLIPNSAGAYYDGSINSSGYANYIVNFQYSLSAGDYVEFTVGGNANLVLDNSGYFCGYLLS